MIDYHTTDFEEVLTDIDLVFDTMGGEIQKKSFSVLKEHGRLISVLSIEDETLARKRNKLKQKQFGYVQMENS